MKVLIVEDEKVAADQLQEFVRSYDTAIEVVTIINSCKGLRKWLAENEAVDLIFCDIELSDGNVLNTLKNAELNAAVIFTTAYDTFWSQALKLNGIEYLLKPITAGKVHTALAKTETIKKIFSKDKSLLSRLETLIQQQATTFYKKRFPIRMNNEVFVLEADSILLFRIVEGVILAFTEKARKYPLLEETLNDLETKLNPELFFRINRSEIINARFIESIKIEDATDYSVKLKGMDERLAVSSSRVVGLKAWLDDPWHNLKS